MTITLRRAAIGDVDAIFPMTRALNEHEGIELDPDAHRRALAKLLGDPSLGGVWAVVDDGRIVGYAICTYSFDLEFNGREAYLTELWIDDTARSRGAGSTTLDLLVEPLREAGVQALHLQVRPDNRAFNLYVRKGFVPSPRTIMTRRL